MNILWFGKSILLKNDIKVRNVKESVEKFHKQPILKKDININGLQDVQRL